MANHPTFREALRFWLKLGFISFGGPTGQIAVMHAELVEKRKWIGERRFLHALNYCMLLPGPEATQLATYCGWLLHRTWGGIAAGVLFFLPAAVLLWVLSWIYVAYGQLPWIAAIFNGLKPAVTAVVAAAVIRIGRRALKGPVMWAIAGAAFVAIFWLKLPFPAIVAAAAIVGFVGGALKWNTFVAGAPRDVAGLAEPGHAPGQRPGLQQASAVIGDTHESPAHTRPSLARAIKVLAVSLPLWWAPVVLAGWWQGWDGTLAREGVFFSKAAMMTFGGAYAVLPYVSQEAVEHYAWLTAPQMMDGLGLAETTPGPLIMVVQFVGFLGGWFQPDGLPPMLAATLGAAITTWTTFVPCFLWIFLGAPHVEQLRGNIALGSALAAVTAAVVGVVLNLAVWFGLHVFFPQAGGIGWFAIILAVAAFTAMQRFKIDLIPVILACGLAGLVRHLINGLVG